MGFFKLTKSFKKNKKRSNIESLPHELLTEVLARTAASSLTSLVNAKLCSKVLNEAANNDYVFQKTSVELFLFIRWRKSQRKEEEAAYSDYFWERCKKSKNPDALYRQGVIDYFGLMRKEESGLEFIKQAAKLGHNGARYILGTILLLSEEDDLKKKGVEVLGELRKSNVRLRDCRKEFEFIVRGRWLTNQICRKRHKYCVKRGPSCWRPGWESDVEEDIGCDACLCDKEIASFCSLFSVG